MTTNSYQIKRRNVLKSAAVVGAIGTFGLPVFSSPVAAAETTTDFLIYALEHNNQGNAAGDEGGQADRPDRLLVIDSTDLSAGDITDEINATYFDLEIVDEDGDEVNANLNTATLAAGYRADTTSPVVLYGIHRAGAAEAEGSPSDSQAFKIEVPDSGSTATVQLFGAQNAQLGDIWASAIDANSDWYGIDQNENALYGINLDSDPAGAPTKVGDLLEDDSSVDPINVGMGVNFLTDELWSVFTAEGSDQSDVVSVDKTDGTVDTIGEEVLTDGNLVGAAFGPCANVLYVVRNGSELYGYDVSDNSELAFGTIQYDVGEDTYEAGVDNLAVPYGYECFECEPCEEEDLLAKYEFECEEYDDEECDNYDFMLEGDGDDSISYAGDNYENKDHEKNEPVSVTFETEYCELYAFVKAGPEEHCVEADVEEGEATVDISGDSDFTNNKNGKQYAISYVEFYCECPE